MKGDIARKLVHPDTFDARCSALTMGHHAGTVTGTLSHNRQGIKGRSAGYLSAPYSEQHMKRFITAIALSFLVAGAASATSSYSGSIGAQGYVGTVAAQSSSSTVGGSSFSVGVNSNGKASGFANSNGGGSANAGGAIDSNGVTTFTNNSSYSNGAAQSHVGGSATGTGSAAQGTDTNAAAVGQFGKIGAGFGAGISFGH